MIFTSAASAETLTAGKAYVVSSINVNASQTIQSGQSYSLVPQVIVATGNENYVGSVSTFTGCFNGKRYEAGTEKGNCLTSVINNLTSTSTTDALSAAKGKDLQDQINALKTALEEVKNNATFDVNDVYPVGSIYMSVSSTSPATLFGGTWEQLKDRFLLGAGNTYTNGSTGGSTTNNHTHNVTTSGTVQSHTLTINEIPSHSHYYGSDQDYGGYNGSGTFQRGGSNFRGNLSSSSTGGGGGHSHGFSGATVTSGGASDTNNMPPYLAVYMWKRTA